MSSFAHQGTMYVVIEAEKGCLGQGWKLERGSGWGDIKIHSMGLVWREVHSLARRIYIPSKGSFFFHYCYTRDNYSLYMSFKQAPVLFIFSPLQGKNKPHDRVQSIVFILGSGKLNRTGSVYTVNSTQQCISESETVKGKRFTGWKVQHSKHHPQEQNPQNCTKVLDPGYHWHIKRGTQEWYSSQCAHQY